MPPMSVIDVVMISSPGSGSMAATAQCTAAVPEVTRARVGRAVARGEGLLELFHLRALGAVERAGVDHLAEELQLLVSEIAASVIGVRRQ